MNYRHAYHAGNFADVFKHIALTRLLTHLKAKDKPFVVIDTHAGTGRYDLASVEAQRTGEAREGIFRLMAGEQTSEPLLAPYLDALSALNPESSHLRYYPGSPALALGMLRDTDRLVAVELHPEDGATLTRVFAHDPRVQVRIDDGYRALKALLPPKERRGLVLIDPPFEIEDEFETAARALKEGLRRWATGIFALWYPVKRRDPVERFLDEMAMLGRPALTAEIQLSPSESEDRLNGAGLFVVNPPWHIDDELSHLVALMRRSLNATGPGGVRWVIRE